MISRGFSGECPFDYQQRNPEKGQRAQQNDHRTGDECENVRNIEHEADNGDAECGHRIDDGEPVPCPCEQPPPRGLGIWVRTQKHASDIGTAAQGKDAEQRRGYQCSADQPQLMGILVKSERFHPEAHGDGNTDDDDGDRQRAVNVFNGTIRRIHHPVRRCTDGEKGAEKCNKDTYRRHGAEDNEFGIANMRIFRREDDNQRKGRQNL